MTDNEIIKALECCGKYGTYHCDNLCPMFYNGTGSRNDCRIELHNNALSIINRQKAELDDLKRDYLPRCKDALRRANEIGMALEKENQELREEIERLQKEIKTTRAYIHDNGLEWDLPSYGKRNGW